MSWLKRLSLDRRRFGRNEHVFVWLTLGLAATKAARSLLPPLLPAIIADLGISPATAGVGLTLSGVCFALMQYPGGHLSDVLTRKTVLVAGLAVVALGATILVFVRGLWGFLLGAAILGSGVGIYGPADRAQITDLFTARRGLAFGFNTAATDVGGVTATIIAAGVVGAVAWQLSFVPVVLGLVVVLLALALLITDPFVVETAEFAVVDTARRVLGTPGSRNVIVAYALYNFVVQGVIGFLPTLLHTGYGYDFALATQLFGLIYAIGLVVRPLAGQLSDRISRPVVGTAGVGLAGVGILLIVSSRSLAVVVAGVVAFAIGQKSFPPVMQAYLMEGFPDESMGGDLGLTRTTYIGVGSLGPTFVGVTATATSYRLAFCGLLVSLVLSTLVLFAGTTD